MASSSSSSSVRPHVVIIPYPAQGHVTPMLHLAKLLRLSGSQVTFVNTEYNHRRMLRSAGPTEYSLADGDIVEEGFRFEAIPDGLPPTDGDDDVTQDIPKLCMSTRDNCGPHLRELLLKLNSSPGVVPPVSCVIADLFMSFAVEVAKEVGVVALVFMTTSACGFMCYLHYLELIKRGWCCGTRVHDHECLWFHVLSSLLGAQFKDESYFTNGYLETVIDWIPGMKSIRLKDIPSFIRTTDPNDTMLNFDCGEAQNAFKSSGVILNTFDELEQEVIDEMKKMFPHLYTIGPLIKFVNEIAECPLKSIGSNLWKEDLQCIEWLNGREVGSVVYVNFGSITVMTSQQLEEFAWGLANSKHSFLWVIRPDLVAGGSTVLSEDFVTETRERSILVSWCPQEEVLSHSSIGVFLTHSGWNSTLESICGGVPMICWPFFAEQPTNCRYVCEDWGIGIEIDSNVRREDVERMVREMMEGEKGKDMRLKARNWKVKAEEAAREGGSSYRNMNMLIHDLEIGNFQVVDK